MSKRKEKGIPFIILLSSLGIIISFNILWIKIGALPLNILLEPALWSWSCVLATAISSSYLITSKKLWIPVFLQCILIIFLICNLMYYDSFGSQIPVGAYHLICNLSGFMDAVFDSFDTSYIIFPIIILSNFLFNKIKINLRLWYLFLIISLISIPISFNYPEPFTAQYKRLKLTHGYNSATTIMYSPFVYLIDQIYKNDNFRLTQEQRDNIYRIITNNQNKLHDRSNGRNYKSLVIILLESFESFIIDLTVDNKEISPNINQLSKRKDAIYIREVLPEVGIARSMDAQLLINSGLIPPSNEAFCFVYPGNHYPSIARIMAEQRDAEIRVSITSDMSSTYNQAKIAPALGFDKLLTRKDFQTVPPSLIHVDDSVFLEQSTKLLAESLWPINKPAVIQLVTYSCHAPFRLPAGSKKLHFHDTHSKLSKYFNTIHRTDIALGRFIESLTQRADYDSTLIVITGDHPVFSYSKRTELGIDKFTDSPPSVPLIILNSTEHGEIPNRTVQSSIYPTLLELLGLTKDVWPGIGKSIFNTESLNYTPSEISNLIIKHDYLRDYYWHTKHRTTKKCEIQNFI